MDSIGEVIYFYYDYFSASLYHLHTTSEHSGVTNMYSLSNAASRSNTPLPLGLHQASGVVPPGGGILVGGPNHHASQHHLHTSQLLIDGLDNQYHLIQLNGGGNAISHSHTLPHSMSHHSGKGNTACAFDICLYLTPFRQARQLIETCGT